MYKNDELVQNYDATVLHPALFSAIKPHLEKTDAPWIYTITKERLFVACIPVLGTEYSCLIGPTAAFTITSKQIQNLAKYFGLSKDASHGIMYILNRHSRYTIEQSKSFMGLLDFLLNKNLESEGVLVDLESTKRTINESQHRITFINEVDNFSATERELLSHIQYGRIDLLKQSLNKLFLSEDTIPNISPNEAFDFDFSMRKLFIANVGTVSRAAVRGGLDYNTMSEMNSYYLNKIDTISETAKIINLMTEMMVAFAKLIERRNEIPTNTKVSNKVKKMVFAHINEKITPTIIAEMIEMDVSYICRHFKKETSMTISSFINHVKMQECQRLLESTDMSVLEISTHLGYSSSNYMSKVFKGIVGVSPNEFRENLDRA